MLRDDHSHPAQRMVVERFFDLAVARILQLDRQINADSMAKIGGNPSKAHEITDRMTNYQTNGAVTFDPESKVWSLSNPNIAIELLKRRNIRPLKLGEIALIRSRNESSVRNHSHLLKP